jgi:general nucleoside transport system permease protein
MSALSIATDVADATVRTATPLLLAALGETVAERAGVINIGLEGTIIVGCLTGVIAATPLGATGGLLAAALGGVCLAAILALFVITLRADQIITGTAISMLGLGATGAAYRAYFGSTGAALTTPTLPTLEIPGLHRLPVIGRAIFSESLPTYLAIVLAIVVWFGLYRTHRGLALRAIGESPAAARASGVPMRRLQLAAILFSGACGGLAGGTLSLAQVGTFAEGMSAGRGFIAIAIVALGRWHPLGATLAALVFGFASAVQYLFQALAINLPYQLFLALPYVLTLVALALSAGRYAAPASLGQRTGVVTAT